MNTVVSNVRTRTAKVRVKALAAGLSADAGTPSNVLAVRGFVARVGAVLAVFMLAFSLLMPATPAHAYDSIRIWTHVKIDGDKNIHLGKKPMLLTNTVNRPEACASKIPLTQN